MTVLSFLLTLTFNTLFCAQYHNKAYNGTRRPTASCPCPSIPIVLIPLPASSPPPPNPPMMLSFFTLLGSFSIMVKLGCMNFSFCFRAISSLYVLTLILDFFRCIQTSVEVVQNYMAEVSPSSYAHAHTLTHIYIYIFFSFLR